MIDKKNDPRRAMKLPEGFFDQIEEEIMDQISSAKVVPFRSMTINKVMAIGAVEVLLIAALYVMNLKAGEGDPTFAELSADQNWDYFLENSDEITYEELADFEESDAAIEALEEEIYGNLASEDFLEEIDLETIQNLYE